jgi:hypothetical protein
MTLLPSNLAARYRFATCHEIRSWSFGALRARRAATSDWRAHKWRDQCGTLDDQAIFGPVRDCECACGKYIGARFRNMICDVCGVKLASPAVRRVRFGHIDLPFDIQHPLASDPHLLSAVPVLPAGFLSSPAGTSLAELYEQLVDLAALDRVETSSAILIRLAGMLLPAVQLTDDWRLAKAAVLARGLALVPREPEIEADGGPNHI